MDVMTSVQHYALRDAYKSKFQPLSYVDFTRGRMLFVFFQTELHNIFKSDLVQGKKTLLEVGSGPTINSVLSASRRFQDIVLSDLVEANRVELQKWLSGSEEAVDWTFRAETVAELEGCSDVKEGASQILERTRRAIRKVVPCDVLEPAVLPEDHREVFDVVLCCNVLEVAAKDHATFGRLLGNVTKLVKPGGLLILVGVGGMAKYHVADEEFSMADVNEDVIKTALADARLKVEVYTTKMYNGHEIEANGKRFGFVIAARTPE